MGPKGEGCLLISNACVGKDLEDLLQCRLCNAVLFDSKCTLFVFQLAEEPSDCLLLLGDAKLEELTTLLQDLNFLEVSGQEGQDSKAVGLRTQPLDQVSETHFATVIKVSLSHDILAQAVSSADVLEDELVELLALKLLDRARQVDLLLNVISKAELLRILLLLLIV